MRLLDNVLPSEFRTSDGGIYTFSTDFRDWMRFECLMLDKDIPDTDKPLLACQMIFPKQPHEDVNAFLLWFYRGGNERREIKSKAKKHDAAYSYEYDEELIYAAFMQCYRIDLCESDMHWWKFRALFDGLSDDTKFRKVMGYRTMEIDDKVLGTENAKRYRELKKIYRLPRYLSEQQKIDEAKRILRTG